MNLVIIRGYLGRDPETRYTPNGDAVTGFSVATSYRWKDKSGEEKEKTEWHRCIAFQRRAEVIGEYFVKGSQILVRGRLQTREWTDKKHEDVKHYSTEIVVDEFEFLDRKGDKPASEKSGGEERGASSRPGRTEEAKEPAKPKGHFDDMPDDIPF